MSETGITEPTPDIRQTPPRRPIDCLRTVAGVSEGIARLAGAAILLAVAAIKNEPVGEDSGPRPDDLQIST